MANAPKVKHRVGPINAFFLITSALLLDGVQFILTLTGFLILLADLITLVATPMYAMWFFLIDPQIFGGNKWGRKFATELVTSVAEFIPIIDALPVFTAGVITFIQTTRAEDKEKHTLHAAARAKAEAAAEKKRFEHRQRVIAQLQQPPAIPRNAPQGLREEEPEAVY